MRKFNDIYPKKLNACIGNRPVSINIKTNDFNIAAGCVSLLDTELTEEISKKFSVQRDLLEDK